ncbi:MAG: pyruvate dehydrogenase (acetyl-transferring) E1 component subunit alpha [Candidatus Micrarchaeota archaeon]|nr:pyruvate dehydrogenase (acetyl-transferring) E1 component subunit alpha [Candidatus Micrarchaeota archaeon]
MVSKETFNGSVEYVQVMDENGNVDQSLFPQDLKDEQIVEMLKWMILTRALDAKTLSLQRQGRVYTYAPLVGEEATQVGTALAMRKQDMFVPGYRQHGVYLVRGASLEAHFMGWRGFEEGLKVPKEVGGLPVSVPVGTQILHAVGLAFAQKYKKQDSVVLGYTGDGGTSEGDFYESLNFAGVWKVPVVAVVENNEWAISVPRSHQTAAQTLAQKAIAAGIKGVQVDGNDVIGVYKVTKDAIESAKNGMPVMIESMTYRMSMHTTADDPTKYRDPKEVEYWKARDPIDRVRKYLTAKNLWNADIEAKLAEENSKRINEAVEKAEAFKGDPKSMFENAYSFVPETLQEELDDAEANNFWQ